METNQTKPQPPAVTYISEVDCAKQAVEILKVDFPATTFKRKTHKYAGGSSIRISWVNGPAAKQVEARIGHMAGASFDGMTDMKSYHDTTEIVLGDGGTPTTKQVRYANDYMFCERSYTAQAYEVAIAACERDHYQANTGWAGWCEITPGATVISRPSKYNPNGFDVVNADGQTCQKTYSVLGAWLAEHDLSDMANPVKLPKHYE